MKTAHNSEGLPIPAGADAPEKAICPFCGGIVVLRHRKLMNNGGMVYFWRHRANEHLDCAGRARRG